METLIGVGLFGGITSAFVAYQISQMQAAQTNKLTANLSAFQSRAVATISNDSSWLKTTENANSSSQLDCIGSAAGCSSLNSSYDVDLYLADGSMLYSRSAVSGFQLNGTACAANSSGNNCPVQLTLQWRPLCSNISVSGDTACKYPLIEVNGTFTAPDLPQVDLSKFNFKVLRSPTQLACVATPPVCGSHPAICTFAGWECPPPKPTRCAGTVTWNDAVSGFGPCTHTVPTAGILHDTATVLTNTDSTKNGSASFLCVPGEPLSVNNTGFLLQTTPAATCEARVHGQCGLAHNNIRYSVPTAGPELCSAGTATATSNAGPWVWSWSCQGSGGGSSMNCSSNPPSQVIGSCGTANNTVQTVAPSGAAQCSVGTPTAAVGSNPWSWVCEGAFGGSNVNCGTNPAPIPGSCGSAHNTVLSAAPSGGSLCLAGNSSVVVGTNPWSWTCGGQHGGSTASCGSLATGIAGSCGSAHNTVQASAPLGTAQCSAGSPSAVIGSNPWTWTCAGQNGGPNASCNTNSPSIAGVCGSAHNTSQSTAPTGSLLCSTGSASVLSGTNPWSWTCAGENGGATVNCNTSSSVIAGSCGTAHNTVQETAPSGAALCSAGGASVLTGSNPWSWSCTGQNGGQNASCSTRLAVASCSHIRPNVIGGGGCGGSGAYVEGSYTEIALNNITGDQLISRMTDFCSGIRAGCCSFWETSGVRALGSDVSINWNGKFVANRTYRGRLFGWRNRTDHRVNPNATSYHFNHYNRGWSVNVQCDYN